jgi:hypothetical protein
MVYKLIVEPRIPPYRATIGPDQVIRMAGHASIGNLIGALGHELAVGGTTAGTDPLGGGGGS